MRRYLVFVFHVNFTLLLCSCFPYKIEALKAMGVDEVVLAINYQPEV